MNAYPARVSSTGARIAIAVIAVGLSAVVIACRCSQASAAPPASTSPVDPDEAETTGGARCGEERAAIKLGLDNEARLIVTTPFSTTISALTGVRHPVTTPADTRASSVERTVYRLQATVVGYKLEADQDFHLVIDDRHGHHMVVEVPSPDCVGANRTAPANGAGKPRAESAWRDQVVAARAAVLQILAEHHLPAPGAKLRRTEIQVVITGVGFFDKIHGQDGVAPNGIELHPVLAIALGGRS